MNVDFGADYTENDQRIQEIEGELRALGQRMDELQQERLKRLGRREYLQEKAKQILTAQQVEGGQTGDQDQEQAEEPDGLRIVSD